MMNLLIKKWPSLLLRAILPSCIKRQLFALSYHLVSLEHKVVILNMVSLSWSLEKIKSLGFEPRAIIDVGAYAGEWTRSIRHIFPDARFLMVEAQPKKMAHLENVKRMDPGRLLIKNCLLGPETKSAVPFFEMDTGSSVLEENSCQPREKIFLDMTTLDSLLSEFNLQGPLLLKLDVQGFELEVLRGSRIALDAAEFVLLEVSTLNYNRGAPLVAEVLDFMNQRGFVLFDIADLGRKSNDQVLFQMDVLFAKKDSNIRTAINHF